MSNNVDAFSPYNAGRSIGLLKLIVDGLFQYCLIIEANMA
jgi:hypothetical protein